MNNFINNSPIRHLWMNCGVAMNGRSKIDIDNNGGWPSRDDLPTNDPIGDVDENHCIDAMNYYLTMKDRVINPEGKNFTIGIDYAQGNFPDIDMDNKCCYDPANHKKIHLITTAYKMCTICKSDLGDW